MWMTCGVMADSQKILMQNPLNLANSNHRNQDATFLRMHGAKTGEAFESEKK